VATGEHSSVVPQPTWVLWTKNADGKAVDAIAAALLAANTTNNEAVDSLIDVKNAGDKALFKLLAPWLTPRTPPIKLSLPVALSLPVTAKRGVFIHDFETSTYPG
jgi:hypothetical protein